MHFSKSYAQLLLSLPPELRDNAIQYRQLKKLINQIVNELSSLGLSPAFLNELFEAENVFNAAHEESVPNESLRGDIGAHLPRAAYEFAGDAKQIEPRLRLWLDLATLKNKADRASLDDDNTASEDDGESIETDSDSRSSLLSSLQRLHLNQSTTTVNLKHDILSDNENIHQGPQEVVIPLVSDIEFFHKLTTALEALSAHFLKVQGGFKTALQELARVISDSARPASETTSFHPFSSITSHVGTIRVPNSTLSKSDLYKWREIFQLYVEAEVFESMSEASRGEWSVEESEKRLKLFADRITQRGLGDPKSLKLQSSRLALETFLGLNLFILNIKKFSFANSEAIRKILKKHTKRTSLPLPPSPSDSSIESIVSPQIAALSHQSAPNLPRSLVQAIGETLLPVIPHLDDYSCLICTSIAFKPIRLSCGHLFCVRCLVKMQKRGNNDCPMCRAPSVLVANRSNVDWALLNFMQDWFPLEAREKLKSNEREAAEEELREMGLDPHQTCLVM